MHLVLNPRGVGYGAGLYGLAPEVLERYRARLCDPAEAAAFAGAVDRAATVGARMGAPDLARPPKGYPAEGRAADFLRYKSIVVRTFDAEPPPAVLLGPGALDWAVETTRAFLPLLAWLRRL
jgi:uncharacterized protein (DUF2461 family)